MTQKNPPKKRAVMKTIMSEAARSAILDDPDYSLALRTAAPREATDIRSTAEMVAFLESEEGKKAELTARVIHHKEGEGFGIKTLGRSQFLEAVKKNTAHPSPRKFREAYSDFSRGGGAEWGNTVGNDFTPLLGGPFYKQLYYYNDWLKMHQDCFFAYHHDPVAKASVNILVDFTLGTGFRVEFENPVAQAIWEAFEQANDFQEMFRNFAKELSAYGENMLWWLPNNEKYIVYPKTQLNLDDVPKVIMPRLRIADPSNFVEIVTYPEDITRRLFYVWLTPTQYQTYTGKDEKTGQLVQNTKLIYQQIPAHQIMHYTVNSVSNEKRGRSDLFAGLPYFKRLRDAVNFEIIAQQKNAAWAIDTTIEGDDNDIAAYIADQRALGTIPNAGSEFVHTKAITREYLANQGAGSRNASNAFDWCLSMAAMAVGVPVSYYGTHLSGGQTRASALVATEPVAKRFEMRRQVYKRVVGDVARHLLEHFGLKSKFEITFPELITQDRSAKLKDLALAESSGWIAKERAAETAAAELGFTDYDFQKEQEKNKAMQVDADPITDPLTGGRPVSDEAEPGDKPSAVTGQERREIKQNG